MIIGIRQTYHRNIQDKSFKGNDILKSVGGRCLASTHAQLITITYVFLFIFFILFYHYSGTLVYTLYVLYILSHAYHPLKRKLTHTHAHTHAHDGRYFLNQNMTAIYIYLLYRYYNCICNLYTLKKLDVIIIIVYAICTHL